MTQARDKKKTTKCDTVFLFPSDGDLYYLYARYTFGTRYDCGIIKTIRCVLCILT